MSWTTSPSDRGRTSRLGLPQDEPRAIAATGHGHRTERRRRILHLAQVVNDGRLQGGRAPYGYVVVDAGPHPKPRKAAED